METEPIPIASILVTTYNLQAYVRQTLDSILGQEVSFPYEVLVGDDGSSDETASIVKEYCESTNGLVKLFVMQRAKDCAEPAIVRASQNRLNLARHARGKYLVYLDGDDYFTDMRALQKRVDVLEDPKNIDCVACGGNLNIYNQIDGSRMPKVAHKIIRSKIDGKRYWRSGLSICAEAFLLRNVVDVDDAEGERLSPYLFDDNMIVYAYLKHGDLYYINSADIDYRQNENGFLSKPLEEQVFVNMLGYCHARHYGSKIGNALRYYSTLKMLRNRTAVLSDELMRGREVYGQSVQELPTIVARWQKDAMYRNCLWPMLCVLNILNRLQSKVYLNGFRSLLNGIKSRIKTGGGHR